MRIPELCFFENGPLESIEIWSKVEILNAPFQGRNRQFLPHPGKIREPNLEESASHDIVAVGRVDPGNWHGSASTTTTATTASATGNMQRSGLRPDRGCEALSSFNFKK